MDKLLGLRRYGMSLLLLTVAIGPFFQGYFFPNPTLIAVGATALGVAVWLVGRRVDRMGLDLADALAPRLLIGLLVWCLAVSIWSVYARGNLDLILEVTTALLVYVLCRGESGAPRRMAIVHVLTVTALVVALFGLLEYGGFFMQHPDLSRLFNIEPQRSRMYTLFQYPNTAAAFFLIVGLLLNAVLVQSTSLFPKLLLAAASGIVSTSFVLTVSRGSLVIAPLGTILLWMGLSRADIACSFGHLLSAVVLPATVALYPITLAAPQGQWTMVLLWAAVSATVAVLSTWGLHYVLHVPRRIKAAIVMVLVVLVGTAGGIAASAYTDVLPGVFSRITQFELSDITRDGRFDFFKDAAKLAANRPWGYGGGGWLRSYQQVQEVNYVARDPHSHYALMLVEAGVPGLVLLAAAIAAAAYTAFRARRGDPIRWAMAAGALTLAAHAAIDIDLSYYMLWLLLWVMLGLAQPDAAPIRPQQERRFTFPAALFIALITMVSAGILAVAGYAYQGAQVAVLTGNEARALQLGWRAIALDPLNSQYRTLIPTQTNVARAMELDPHNPDLWRFLAQLRLEQGDVPAATDALRKALQLQPMSVGRYEELAELLEQQMVRALQDGNLETVSGYAHELVELGQAIERRGVPSLKRQEEAFPTYPALTMSTVLHHAVGKAHLVLGQLDDAEQHLKAAMEDPSLIADVALWLHALYARSGDEKALAALEPVPSQHQLESDLYETLLTLP